MPSDISTALNELKSYDLANLSDLEHIKTIQATLFPSNMPKEITQAHLPFWLLWTPTYATLKDNTPKILKVPSAGKNWVQNTKTFKYTKTQLDTIVSNSGIRGLGFLFSTDHPYIVIDIDSLQSKDNLALIKALDSYTEYSPGLEGVHVWVKVLTNDVKKEFETVYGRKQLCKKTERDLFISSSYVTVTGRVEDPLNIKPIKTYSYQDLFDTLEPYFKPKLAVLPTPKPDNKKDFETVQQAEKDDAASQAKLLQQYGKNKKKQLGRLTTGHVRNLLRQINVQTLTSDVFTRVYSATDLAVLDLEENEEAREPWLTICQGVHHNFQGHRYGLQLLHEWSSKGNKYDAEALNSVYESFTVEPQYSTGNNVVTIGSLILLVKAQTPQFSDTKPRGGPLSTLNNLLEFFEFYKYQFKYNTVTFETECLIPEKTLTSLGRPKGTLYQLGAISRIVQSELLKLGFSPSGFGNLTKSIEDHAKLFPYNPVEIYFRKLKDIYDPTATPFDELFETLDLQDHVNTGKLKDAMRLFLRKWLIQVAAAANTSDTYSNKIFNSVLIFVGGQGIGKTRWVQALFPRAIEHYCASSGSVDVQSFRTDKVKQAIELNNTLISNINEIDTHFRKKNYSAFKQLLDENTSKMVLPYGRSATTMVRRTVFIGSTNKEDFLVDHSGNRRFTIIPVNRLDFEHDIDLDQLWSHVMHWYMSKEKWWLDKNNIQESSAMQVQQYTNLQNMSIGNEFLVDEFESRFDSTAPKRRYKRMVFKQIAAYIPQLSAITINSKQYQEAKETLQLWLKKTRYGETVAKAKASNASQFYLVPPSVATADTASFRQVADENSD
jgi:predicted P-loop ATPase